MKKSIICHLFYPKVAKQLLWKLQALNDDDSTFFFNIQSDNNGYGFLNDEIKNVFHNAQIVSTPNKGRDIGAKLYLINLLIELKFASKYTLIIHDKKSPHLGNGDLWRNELFKIINPLNLNRVFEIFENQPSVGIVGSSKYIQNEYIKETDSFACNSNEQIKDVLKKYDIHTSDYNFVAGNIFWIRTMLLKQFFENRSILEIRADLETGNALDFDKGTYIHSWERVMSWIATSQEYKIYGV